MKKLLLLIGVFLLSVSSVLAQCAMCRTTLENNVSNGNIGIAAGINTGILYLFFAPYLAVGVIAWFWYRSSKFNGQQELSKGTVAR
jgi:hypothetical protein